MSSRLALIIASNQFEDETLRQLVAPAEDARSLARVFADPKIGSFEVKTLINESSYVVSETIEAFFEGRQPEDLLLLYYSGHGVKDKQGRLYFVTPNTRRRRLRTTSIPASTVNDIMRYSRSRRQVLLLDCCYSGAFARGMVAKAAEAIGGTVGVNEQLGGRGRVVLTASDALQYAFEGDAIKGQGTRSIFTDALVKGLETGEADRNGDGQISLDELYDYVHDQVTLTTPQQIPEKWEMGVQGNIIIARGRARPAQAAPLPAWLEQALASPDFSARIYAVSELRKLLQGSNRSLAEKAQVELGRLSREDPDSTVRGAAAGALEIVPGVSPSQARPSKPAVTDQVRPETKASRIRRQPAPETRPSQRKVDKRQIFQRIQTIVSDLLGVEASQVTPQARFAEDLEADSLDCVELVMALEEEFDIEISDEEAISYMTTVGEAAALIQRRSR